MENEFEIKKLQARLARLETITDVSHYISSSLTTAEIRKKVMESSSGVLNSETATLYLYDQKTTELVFETVLGAAGAHLSQMRIPSNDRSIAGSCALHRKPEIINNVEKDPRHFKKADQTTKFTTRNMMVAPVIFRDNLYGVLQVINKKDAFFTQDDLDLLIGVSDIVAIALENARLYETLKNQFTQTIEAMAYSIEKRDKYTGGHTKRVTFFSVSIAREMGLSPQELEDLRLSSILHDIGKIGVEDKILNKPAPLTKEEFEVMKTHAEIGYQILAHVETMEKLLGGIRYHHERYDGKGYPLALKETDIPLFARIIAVADTFDAMVSHRPYRNGLPPKVAYDEIVNHAGTQFDPMIVKAFESAFVTADFPKFVVEAIGPAPFKVIKEAA